MKKTKNQPEPTTAERLPIVFLPISEIKLTKNNPRKHSAEQVRAIAASITEYGFNVPLVLDKDHNLLAGEGRLEALKSLGRNLAPCLITDLTGEKARQYVFADNKAYESGEWHIDPLDLDLLKGMPDDVRGMFELEISLFSPQPQETPELQKKTSTIRLTLDLPRRKYLALEKAAGKLKMTAKEYALKILCKPA